MEFDLIWMSIAIALFGYFIGDGLKNFKNPTSKNFFDSFADEDKHELIPKKEAYYFIGIKKEDMDAFIESYPDIPHIKLNDSIYFPREQLRQWLINIQTKSNS